jgi:hypothetical protein
MVNILIDAFLVFGIASLAVVLFAGLFYGLALIAIWMESK